MSFKSKKTSAILGIAILLITGLGVFSCSKKPPSFHALLNLCKRLDSLPPEQKHTLEVLLKTAKTKDCRQASDILINLTSLDLSENQISDVTPLANLTNLTQLDLSENQISDITPLAKLTNLTELGLWQNEISDVTPLANLTNLTVLYLGENEISDITPLANLTNLTWLYLEQNPIKDKTPLNKLTSTEIKY